MSVGPDRQQVGPVVTEGAQFQGGTDSPKNVEENLCALSWEGLSSALGELCGDPAGGAVRSVLHGAPQWALGPVGTPWSKEGP